MWWRNQNLDQSRRDATGHIWHFRVWHDFQDGRYLLRIFFWGDDRGRSGVVECVNDSVVHVSQVRQRIRKLVSDDAYRQRFFCPLRFPVERHYSQVERLSAAPES
jgi:hypothetical protein